MPLYFVDAQRVDSTALASLNPNAVANLYVVKDAAARTLNTRATGQGLLVIITKRNEKNAEVIAFNHQVEQALKEHLSSSEAILRAENAYQPADVRYYLNDKASTKSEL